MVAMKVVTIEEKNILQCRYIHISHQSPQKAFYCRNIARRYYQINVIFNCYFICFHHDTHELNK